MRDVIDDISDWYQRGIRFALATVVRTWRSSPRQPGAAMAVSAAGEAVGSVSGGCVEAAVYELARQVLESGQPALETYGVSDDDAFAVGLTCGGVLEIFVQPVDQDCFPDLLDVAAAVEGRRALAVATIVSGPAVVGSHLLVGADLVTGVLGSDGLTKAVADQARGLLEHGTTGTVHLGRNGEQRRDEVTVFVESFAPPPRLIVFGAIDFAGAVARIGKFLGYHVTVCDARPVFATRKRFPDADEVVVDWPHRYLRTTEVDERTVMCVLTHDPKFDVPLLEVALRTKAAYIGAMGSRRTHEDRVRRLREIGVDEASIARLAAPIGLDLGARTPEETAVSIAAEIIAHTWGGSGLPLSRTGLTIHHQAHG